MSSKEKVKIKPIIKKTPHHSETNEAFLVLYNDDVNSFDFVIETLIDVCGHDTHQAEQCALITHYKGKCDIQKGTYFSLRPNKDLLISKGLSVVIE